jgi:predicted negative regulator of RcsB-dependent stress response
MISARVCAVLCLFGSIASADTYQVILRGKVVMQDGSAPPSTAGVQRLCSDSYGDAPGPITNKKGEYLWRMDVDNMLTRTCRLEATLPGYVSTSLDISDLNGFISSARELPPLVLHLKGSDPRTIVNSDSDVPSAARAPWKAAMQAVNSGNVADAANQLKLVVAAAPKFARGWHSLGIAYETEQMLPEARDAYTHATDADPKLLISWVTLSRMDVLVKDWSGAAKAADTAIKLDLKHMYPEVYLHQAVARYELKDLQGAESSATQALQLDAKERKFRGEFVMGRILAAKGDTAGAKTHISKYLALDPSAPDKDLLKGYLEVLGKPEAAGINPDLELP